jgi:endonuclease/exonuclease/phosphatase family metal-dependent hydrolase
MGGVTIASFNLHWGRRPRTYEPFDVVRACRTLDADVLALQEVWHPDGEPSIADEVGAALGYDVHQVSMGRAVVEPKCRVVGPSDGVAGTGDFGLALLVRVPHGPITHHRFDAFFRDHADRSVITTALDVDGFPLAVCASHFPHLEHLSPLLRWRLRAVLPARDRPAVLMGDLNMWRWVTRIVVPGWRDAVRGATWPSPWPVFQIDHLLTTPGVVATAGEVVRVGASDHLAVRARISPA